MAKGISALLAGFLIAVTLFGCSNTEDSGFLNSKAGNPSEGNSTQIVWKEVDTPNKSIASTYILPFDMHVQMTMPDLIFKGRILSHTNYEVSWTKDGLEYGPDENTILQVQILEVYRGRPPAEKDVLDIMYPWSIEYLSQNSFRLTDGSEYVFFLQFFDERDLVEELVGTPYYKTEVEKYADMILGNAFRFLFPIENGKVVACIEYDFEGKATLLTEYGKAQDLAPKSFELFYNGERVPIFDYALFDEDYFKAAIKHFSEAEGVKP